jgi:hypothetical protein
MQRDSQTPRRSAHSRLNASPIRKPLTPIRSSLRQARIPNYATFERTDEPIENPVILATPRRLQPSLPPAGIPTTRPDYTDTYIVDDEDDVENPSSPSADREHAIPTTVTLRRSDSQGVQYRKNVEEHTWTLEHFDITHLDTEWTRQRAHGDITFQDRLWTCRWSPIFIIHKVPKNPIHE